MSIVVFLASILATASSPSFADLEGALENYLLILKGKKKAAELSPEESREVREIHELLQGFGGGEEEGAGDCDRVIESQILGDFSGWEGETIFRLTNGQVWQQTGKEFAYGYAFRPDVVIYSSRGKCTLKVDGISDTVPVRKLK